MIILLFFTHPERLKHIGIKHINWDTKKNPVLISNIDATKSIWIVWDKIEFEALTEYIRQYKELKAVYSAYHRFPKNKFLNDFENYLENHSVLLEKNKISHIPNGGSVYEALKAFPRFQKTEFLVLQERIYGSEKYRSRILNHISKKEIDLTAASLDGAPEAMREMFFEFVKNSSKSDITDEQKRLCITTLKRDLKNYCNNFKMTLGMLD